jgi:hypothetical protein
MWGDRSSTLFLIQVDIHLTETDAAELFITNFFRRVDNLVILSVRGAAKPRLLRSKSL